MNTKIRQSIQWEIGDDGPVFRVMPKLKPARDLFFCNHHEMPIRHQRRRRGGQLPTKTCANFFPADAVQPERFFGHVDDGKISKLQRPTTDRRIPVPPKARRDILWSVNRIQDVLDRVRVGMLHDRVEVERD